MTRLPRDVDVRAMLTCVRDLSSAAVTPQRRRAAAVYLYARLTEPDDRWGIVCVQLGAWLRRLAKEVVPRDACVLEIEKCEGRKGKT